MFDLIKIRRKLGYGKSIAKTCTQDMSGINAHLPDTVGTNTWGAARYGRRTTEASVVRAFKLIDWTMLDARLVVFI